MSDIRTNVITALTEELKEVERVEVHEVYNNPMLTDFTVDEIDFVLNQLVTDNTLRIDTIEYVELLSFNQ